ncbi:hypothetical protein BD414DRAFT_472629 [Trametes punicea]|nr:hypothetical protein BD414DRAFT_472629 [Trametes punicea]
MCGTSAEDNVRSAACTDVRHCTGILPQQKTLAALSSWCVLLNWCPDTLQLSFLPGADDVPTCSDAFACTNRESSAFYTTAYA